MNTNPLVSIIMPCYNYGAFISVSLNKLLEQEYTNWECLIIDNGSTDNSRDEILKFAEKDPRFKYYFQAQAGPSAARNLGLKNAIGKYIQFLDADDFLQENKLFSQVEFLEKNESIDVAFSDALYFENNDVNNPYKATWSVKAPVKEIDGNSDFTYLKLLEGNRLVISGPMFRRNLTSINSGFLENLKYNEDWEFWLRLARNGARFKFVEAKNAKSLIRIHSSNSSKNLNGMYVSELLIYKSIILDQSSKEKHVIIAKKYYVRTWLEIVKRQLKGDLINIFKVYKTLKSSSLLKLQ